MNTLNLAAMSLHKKIVITVLIVMELAVLFLAENYMICSVEDRTMLLKPYSNILSDNSLYVYDTHYISNISDNSISFAESQNNLLKGVEGNYKVYNFLYYINKDYSDYIVYSVDDEIYKSLALPLTSGNYGSKTNSAVASPKAGRGALSVETPVGTLNLDVCGTLTSSTYVPENLNLHSNMTVNDFYGVNDGGNVIITGRSCLGEIEKSFNCCLGFIVKFYSPEAAQKAMNYLNTKAAVVSGSSVKDNTNKAISADLQSFIPIITCVLLIVLIGIISISAMIFDENKYRSGVLWLCGYSRKKIISIQAATIAILLIVSLAVFALLAFVVNRLISNEIINPDSFSKMSFGFGNLAATLITCAVLIIAAVAMPAVKTFKKSPVEYLGRAK